MCYIRILFICFLTCLFTSTSFAQTSIDSPHVLIKFRKEAIKKLKRNGKVSADIIREKLNLSRDYFMRRTALAEWKARKRGVNKLDERFYEEEEFDDFFYLFLPSGVTPEKCINKLRKSPFVEYVETDPVGWGGATPTDPDYSDQWHVGGGFISGIKHINTRLAWDITTGSSSVIVAVLDSGIDSNNSEFAGRVVAGYDFANNDNDPADDHGHGTAVASVLAATGMNTNRGVGVDWQCKIMPVKVLEPDPGDPKKTRGNYSWWAQGILWAAANGAKVLNLSAGGWSSDTNNTLRNAISNAIAAGCIFITITHNNPGWGISYPGLFEESITVGGTDEIGSNCAFSAYGPQIDLVAPATNIFTVSTGNTWAAWWGTSMAAPQVAGAASLICSVRPGLNQHQMKALLCGGANDRDQKTGYADPKDVKGFDNYYGWGRLNVYNSLLLALTEVDIFCTTNNGNIMVSWKTPSNATNNRPFKIEVAASATSSWMVATGIVYESSRAKWIDDGSETGIHPTNSTMRLYRVKVKNY